MSRQSDLDNHANQLNPNNDAYWESRGYDERPDDWEERARENKKSPKETCHRLLNDDKVCCGSLLKVHRVDSHAIIDGKEG